MPIPVQIQVPGRWRFFRRNYRRVLPASLDEVAESRRLPLWEVICSAPGEMGRLMAIRYLLGIPKRVFKRLSDDQAATLLEAMSWLKPAPTTRPVFNSFQHKGVEYFLPSSHGMNMCALEYPIADDAFVKWAQTGDRKHSLLMLATLCRPANPNAAEAITRGDKRIPLLSRSEAATRASLLEDLPEHVVHGVIMYFAGVKEFISNSYGKVLFEGPDNGPENSGQDQNTNTTPTLGWWSIYFSLAVDGPFGRDVKQVYQAPFHEVCLYLVDRIRQQKADELRRKLASNRFGKED